MSNTKSLAIAYAMKKRAKKMAMGGVMESGYLPEPKKMVKGNGMATDEDDKDLNQRPVMAEDSMLNSKVDHEMEMDSKDFSNLDQYADGGAIDKLAETGNYIPYSNDELDRELSQPVKDYGIDLPHVNPDAYAMGGDIVGRIMKKKYSKGGMIANGGEDDLDKMADGRPNNFDDLSLRDDLESSYTGSNSGDFLGNKQEDEDRADIVARIMRKRGKQHNPRPA